MRNAARIKPTLAAVADAWSKVPDLRLGQLLLNTMLPGEDLYQVEDDVLLARLQELMTRIRS
jgi:hypothetical protein